jgi:hypothetical protein
MNNPNGPYPGRQLKGVDSLQGITNNQKGLEANDGR